MIFFTDKYFLPSLPQCRKISSYFAKFNLFHQSQAPKRGIVSYETEQMKGIHMKMRVIFQAYLDICLWSTVLRMKQETRALIRKECT